MKLRFVGFKPNFMRREIFLVTIFIFCLFQATLLDYFKIFGVKPDILLISLVLAGLSFDLKWAVIFSLLCGILKDSFSANIFGLYTLIFSLWGIFIVKLSKKITLDVDYLYVALIAIIVIVNSIIMRLASVFLEYPVVSLGIFLRTSLIEAIYTALISPLLFKYLR